MPNPERMFNENANRERPRTCPATAGLPAEFRESRLCFRELEATPLIKRISEIAGVPVGTVMYAIGALLAPGCEIASLP